MDRTSAIFPPDELLASRPMLTPIAGAGEPDATSWPRSPTEDVPGAAGSAGDVVRVAVVGGGDAGRLVGRMLGEAYERSGDVRHVVSDAGADAASAMWRSTVAEADRIVVTVDAAGRGPAGALAMLDAVAACARPDVARSALAVVLLPPARRGLSRGQEDAAAIRAAFAGRTAGVLFAPRTAIPSPATTEAWRRVAGALATPE